MGSGDSEARVVGVIGRGVLTLVALLTLAGWSLTVLPGLECARAGEDEATKAPEQQYAGVMKRGRGYADDHDLPALRKLLMRSIGRWDGTDPLLSLKCTLQLCGLLSSRDFGKRPVGGGQGSVDMAQEIAISELKRVPDMPPAMHLRFADLVSRAGRTRGGEVMPAAAWLDYRKSLVVVWANAIRVAHNGLDPTWDALSQPRPYPAPPEGHEYGVRPKDIKDRDARTRYAAKIEAQSKLRRAWMAQSKLRNRITRFVPALASRIADAAALSPRIKRDELKRILASMGAKTVESDLMKRVFPPK